MSFFRSEDSNPHIALESFQRYVLSGNNEAKTELEEIRTSIRKGAYGNREFVEAFCIKLESDATSLGLGKGKNKVNQEITTEVSIEMLIIALNEVMKVSLEEMQSTNRRAQIVDARAVFIWLSIKFKLLDKNELTHLLQLDRTSISRLEHRAKQLPKLHQLTNEISLVLFSGPKLK